LLPVLIFGFPGAPIDSTLVLCLCGQAKDLVPVSEFGLPRGTSSSCSYLIWDSPNPLRWDCCSMVTAVTIWITVGPSGVLHTTGLLQYGQSSCHLGHICFPRSPKYFFTACSPASLGQFALIGGVSYVMGGRVGIYDTHCDQLEDLTPPHPTPPPLYPNPPPPKNGDCSILSKCCCFIEHKL